MGRFDKNFPKAYYLGGLGCLLVAPRLLRIGGGELLVPRAICETTLSELLWELERRVESSWSMLEKGRLVSSTVAYQRNFLRDCQEQPEGRE